jgi:hypothetical protein
LTQAAVSRRRLLPVVVGGVLLAGCSSAGPGTLSVPPPTPAAADARACGGLVDAVPDRVAGQDRRSVEPDKGLVAAWGSPAIVLTCGVPRPAGLRPDSQCFTVDGIDWLATQGGREVHTRAPIEGTLVFTTVDRSPYVAVRVPPAYEPAADALVDLGAAVKQHTTSVGHCH